jgi:hypothetical protein
MHNDDAVAGHAVKTFGGALAAVMAAGIGAFAMGIFVIANETGIFVAPSIYGPSGGLSGRSTLAVVAWLIAWGILHARWRERDVAVGRVLTWSLVLVALALIMTFPPVWGLLE